MVRYEVTYLGEKRTGMTKALAIRRAHEFLAKHRDRVTEDVGRWGLGHRFKVGHAKAANTVRASHKFWGLTHNRWGSTNADFYVVVAHMLRAEKYRTTSPDCRHAEHGRAEHVCEDFRVIEEAKPLPARPRERRNALVQASLKAEQETLDIGLLPTEEEIADLPKPQNADQQSKPNAKPTPTLDAPAHPELIGDDVEEALRMMYSKVQPGVPTLVHVARTGTGVAACLISNLRGDEAVRLFSMHLQGANPHMRAMTGGPAPVSYFGKTRLIEYLIGLGEQPFSVPDIVANLGPWKTEEFSRDNPDFKKWRDGAYDALRSKPFSASLRALGYQVVPHKVNGARLQNEHGDDYWRLERIQ